MTTTAPQTWQQAISDIVWHSLIARAENRYGGLSYKAYNSEKGSARKRERFSKAWTSSVEEMHYRFRSAKTRKLFSAAFTQIICANSHGALRAHFDEVSALLLSEDRWQDLRDILMLSLSARSYLKKPSQEEIG